MLAQLFPRSSSRVAAVQSRRRRPLLEDLEARTVLSLAAPALPPPGHAEVGPVAPHAAALTIDSFNVGGISLVNGQLVANATVSGTVKNQSFSIPATIPISLSVTQVPVSSSATPAATATDPAPVSVLHLTLGPVNLSLLGLNVHLGESCSATETTPITVDIVAIPTGATYTSPINGVTYTGGLLGDVLSGVANLLNGSGGLSGLSSTTLGEVETGLTGLLNSILAPASGATGGTFGGTAGAATPAAAAPAPATHEVLELPLGPISLDLLGALVQTSPICLNITATPGPGNLLGNLLG